MLKLQDATGRLWTLLVLFLVLAQEDRYGDRQGQANRRTWMVLWLLDALPMYQNGYSSVGKQSLVQAWLSTGQLEQ